MRPPCPSRGTAAPREQASFAVSAVAYRLVLLMGLVALTAFFSGSETALFSMSRAKRQKLAATGDPTSRLILGLLAKPRRLIATILVGNELVNISAGAVAAGLGEHGFGHLGRSAVQVLTTLIL